MNTSEMVWDEQKMCMVPRGLIPANEIDWRSYAEDTLENDTESSDTKQGQNRKEPKASKKGKKKPFKMPGRDIKTVVTAVHDKKNPFAVLRKATVIDNDKLSFRARGLLAYMLSRPDGWEFWMSHLVKQSPKEKEEAIRSALRELRQLGFIHDHFVKDEKGIIRKRLMVVYEKPKPKKPNKTQAKIGKGKVT